MKREHFEMNLQDVCSMLERLEMDEGVCYDSALYGFLSAAVVCINNSLRHINEFVEHD